MSRKLLFSYLLACIHLVWGRPAKGRFTPEFQHIREGLSQNHISAFLQDTDGVMWIGTYGGLTKYDGANFYTYEADRTDPYALPNNIVNALLEDDLGNVWIGTNEGLALYDRRQNHFQIWNARDFSGTNNDRVSSIISVGEGQIWAAVGDAIQIIDIHSREVLPSFELISQALDGQGIVTMLVGDNGREIFIGTDQGLTIFHTQTKDISYLKDESGELVQVHVRALLQDENGNIWMGSGSNGVIVLQKQGGVWSVKKQFLHDPNDQNSIGNNRILDVLEDHANRLWFAAENGGLNLYNSASDDFIRYEHDPNDPTSIGGNSIWKIYEDRSYRLWVGTFNQGVSLYDPYYRKFQHVRQRSGQTNGLSSNAISSFGQMGNNYFIGSDGGGLTKWNRASDTYEHYKHDPADNNSLASNAVLCQLVDAEGHLWVGTWAGGLHRYNSETDDFTHFRHDPDNPNSISSDNVFGLAMDQSGNIWMGNHLGGVCRLNPSTGQVLRLTPNSEGSWKAVLVDHKNRLWIGSNAGLEVITFKDGDDYEIKSYEEDRDNPKTISSEFIFAIYQDSKNRIWVGTDYGLGLYNEADDGFVTFGKRDGLPHQIIKSIQEDDFGNLWIGTNKGLCRLQIEGTAYSFTNYQKSDGLQGDEFVKNAIFKDDGGQIFVGGNNGFNYFEPGNLTSNPNVPKILLTSFRLFNQEVPIDQNGPLTSHINSLEQITLNHHESVFSIDFAAVNFTHADQNRYRCRLLGFEEGWRELGNTNTVTYTNLDPDLYQLEILASNNDGVWTQNPRRLRIEILPPWWQTMWFRTLVIVFLVSAIGFIIQSRRKRVKLNEKRLQDRILQATNELKAQDEVLRQQHEQLTKAIAETNVTLKDVVEKGDLQQRVLLTDADGAWKALGESINELMSTILVPLNEFDMIVNQLANNDLTVRYTKASKGDIEKVARNINQSLNTLSTILELIREKSVQINTFMEDMLVTSQEIAVSTAEISSAVSEMNSGAHQQQRKVDATRQLIEQMGFSAKDVGDQAVEINETAKRGSSSAEEGKHLAEQLNDSMSSILQLAGDNAQAIGQLTERSKEITSVLRIIKDIAAQTNLLSLNAAIEAAQAGDAGRGFAVVAEEIRKLAEESKKSIATIQEQIDGIQDRTRVTADISGRMHDQIAVGKAASERSHEAFKKIADYYLKTAEKSHLIVEATENQSTQVNNIAELIRAIVVVAEETAAGTEQAASSANEVASGMTGYASQTEEVQKIVNELVAEVNRFKLE